MKKRLLLLSLALIAIMGGVLQLIAGVPAPWASGEENGTSAKTVTVLTDTIRFNFDQMDLPNQVDVKDFFQENVSVVFEKGAGSSTPKYYANGNAIRAYGGNNIIVSDQTPGHVITEVVFGFGPSDGKLNIYGPDGAPVEANGMWTGKGQTIPFNIQTGSGNRRIASLTIIRRITIGEGDNTGGEGGESGEGGDNNGDGDNNDDNEESSDSINVDIDININEIDSLMTGLRFQVWEECDSIFGRYPNVAQKFYDSLDSLSRDIEYRYHEVDSIKNKQQLEEAYQAYYSLKERLESLMTRIAEAEKNAQGDTYDKEAEEAAYAELSTMYAEVRVFLENTREQARSLSSNSASASSNPLLAELTQYDIQLNSLSQQIADCYDKHILADNSANIKAGLQDVRSNVERISAEVDVQMQQNEAEMAAYKRIEEGCSSVEYDLSILTDEVSDSVKVSEGVRSQMELVLTNISSMIHMLRADIDEYHSKKLLSSNLKDFLMRIDAIKEQINTANELFGQLQKKEQEESENQMAMIYYQKLDAVMKNIEALLVSKKTAIMAAGYTSQTIMDMQGSINRYSNILRSYRENIAKAYENGELKSEKDMNNWQEQINYMESDINRLTIEASRMDSYNKGNARIESLRSEFRNAVDGVIARRDKVSALVTPYLGLIPSLNETFESITQQVNDEIGAQQTKVDLALRGMYTQMFGDPASGAASEDDTDYEAIVRQCITNLSATNELIDRKIASLSLAIAAAKKALETGNIMTLLNLASNITHMSIPEIAAMAATAGATGDFSGFTETAKAYLTKGGKIVAESISMGVSGSDDVTLVFRPTESAPAARSLRSKVAGEDIEIVFASGSLIINDTPLEAETAAPENSIDVNQMTEVSDAEVLVVNEVVNSPEAVETSTEMFAETRKAERETIELAQAEKELAQQTEKNYDDFIKEYTILDNKYNEAFSILMSTTFSTEIQNEFQPKLTAIYGNMEQNANNARNSFYDKDASALVANKTSLAAYVAEIDKVIEEALTAQGLADEDAIQSIEADAKAKDGKFLEQGKVVIRKDGRTYNAAGRKL